MGVVRDAAKNEIRRLVPGGIKSIRRIYEMNLSRARFFCVANSRVGVRSGWSFSYQARREPSSKSSPLRKKRETRSSLSPDPRPSLGGKKGLAELQACLQQEIRPDGPDPFPVGPEKCPSMAARLITEEAAAGRKIFHGFFSGSHLTLRCFTRKRF